ncbi:unnamed protein product [Sympodiomycopsis kandeliae]
MGASTSKPASAPQSQPQRTSSSVEKNGLINSSDLRHYHSADRLGKINAERANAQSHQEEDRPASAALGLDRFVEWQDKIEQDPVARLAALTLHNTDPKGSLHRRKAEVADRHVFNTIIDHESLPRTNQQSSGRCWLFAMTNVIRNEMNKTLNIDDFQLSQSYLHFWDKLEKANYFLENVLELYDQPIDGRELGFLKTDPVSDGGQANMAFNLLLKYGVVPQAVYPESFNTSHTGTVNKLITRKLRQDAVELRDLKQKTIRDLSRQEQFSHMSREDLAQHADTICRRRKDALVEEVYKILVTLDGAPPKADGEFTFEYRDDKGAFRSVTSTPADFLRKYAPGFDAEGQVSLVDDPRHRKNVLMTVDRLGNVHGGQPVLYVNTAIETMKATAIATIKAGLPVWFGCDVGSFSDTSSGIMDTDLFDYNSAFGFSLDKMSKSQRIELGESAMTHAMVLTGVHLSPQGKPIRWRVENSWGNENVGDKGFMVMSDAWFDEYVFQVVIRKKFVPSELWQLNEKGVDGNTVVLPPYDPLGALA